MSEQARGNHDDRRLDVVIERQATSVHFSAWKKSIIPGVNGIDSATNG
ncbi:hypothetical protein [Nevskia ramosa]|nr:hypothetical protein [Nevskia ramosa]